MNQIEGQITAGMAQMAPVVHGHATDVHRNLTGLERGEIHFFSSSGVVHANGHGIHYVL